MLGTSGRLIHFVGMLCLVLGVSAGAAKAADPKGLPDIGDAERIVVPGDGLDLTAYLFVPQVGQGPRPAIVFLHGSEITPWYTRNISRALRDLGFVVLALSQRGSAGADHSPSLACQLKADDIVTSIAWLQDQPAVDRERIGLIGGGMGGVVALLTAAKTDLVGAVFVWSTASDLGRWIETDRIQNPNSYGSLRNLLTYGCGSTGLALNSPVNVANVIDVPVMLVHGELDEIFPAEQSRLMFDALREAEGEADLIVMPGELHVMSDAAWREFWPRVIAHFENAFRSVRP